MQDDALASDEATLVVEVSVSTGNCVTFNEQFNMISFSPYGTHLTSIHTTCISIIIIDQWITWATVGIQNV